MRKLVTIRIVDEILPIENADAIELARFGGWQCVVKKGEFQQGDHALYFEIDSMLPIADPRFAFLAKNNKKEVAGVEYSRLKTMRLRGQLSQGLALPLSLFTEVPADSDDIATLLGVIKYEPTMGKVVSADAKGTFPSFIRKTDAERVQNIPWRELKAMLDEQFEVTPKMDGSSITVFQYNGQVGVCSRNLELKTDKPSTFVDTAKLYGYLDKFPAEGYAIQGEMCGPGIQSNHEQLASVQMFVFNVWNIAEQRYLSAFERNAFYLEHNMRNVIDYVFMGTLREWINWKQPGTDFESETAVRNALMASAVGPRCLALDPNDMLLEGYVFKHISGEYQFKVISNYYLEKAK